MSVSPIAPHPLASLLKLGTLLLPPPSSLPSSSAPESDSWLPYVPPPHSTLSALHALLSPFDGNPAILRLTQRPEPVSLDAVLVRVYLAPGDLPGGRNAPKGRAQKLARELREVLKGVSLDEACWGGKVDGGERLRGPMFFDEKPDARSLADIYNQLPSPSLRPLPPSTDPSTLALLARSSDPPGLRSTLYEYQKRSVWRMAQQELAPGDFASPEYVERRAIAGGGTYWLDPERMRFMRQAGTRRVPRGGILCEEMGVGKTVMILSLILLTKHRLPSADIDLRPPTPLDPFPTSLPYPTHTPFSLSRSLPSSSPLPLASLASYATHVLRTRPSPSADWRSPSLDLPPHLLTPLRNSTPFFVPGLVARGAKTRGAAARRAGEEKRRVYLSAGTLVVVPEPLVRQWESEVMKHVGEGELRVLNVERDWREGMGPREVAEDYDIILISDRRFASESIHFHSTTSTSLGATLKQLKLKRLVLDEGHTASAQRSDLVQLAQHLRVEARWLVSGTPTQHCVSSGAAPSPPPSLTPSPTASQLELQQHDANLNPSEDKYASDLSALGRIVEGFLRVDPFAPPTISATTPASGEHVSWAHTITAPLVDRTGARFGARTRLERFLGVCMIRNRHEDVEKEVRLHGLEVCDVGVELEPIQVLSFNVLQALIAVNVVTSRRADQDYFFHPSNAGPLKETLANISRSFLFNTLGSEMNIHETLHIALDALDKADNRGYPPSDVELLSAAASHLRRALADPAFCALRGTQALYFGARGIPSALQEAWTKAPWAPIVERSAALTGRIEQGTCLVDPFAVVRMRDAMADHVREASAMGREADAGEVERVLLRKGWEWREKDRRRAEWEERARGKGGKRKAETSLSTPTDAKRPRVEAPPPPPPPAPSPQKVKPVTKDAHAAPLPAFALGKSALQDVVILDSLSSKVNLILDEIRKYGATEKFLVFSSSPEHLRLVADALALANVRHLTYFRLTGDRHKDIEHNPVTFETNDDIRVLLIDLSIGARGLNLPSASRVIFTEPVWQPDDEAQAIKRAHRIGQTRRVHVTRIFAKNTSEERMLHRRTELSAADFAATAGMQDDAGMREYIANPRFLSESHRSPAASPPPQVLGKLFPTLDDEQEQERMDVDAPVVAEDREDAQRDGANLWQTVLTPPRTPQEEKRKAAAGVPAKKVKKRVAWTDDV